MDNEKKPTKQQKQEDKTSALDRIKKSLAPHTALDNAVSALASQSHLDHLDELRKSLEPLVAFEDSITAFAKQVSQDHLDRMNDLLKPYTAFEDSAAAFVKRLKNQDRLDELRKSLEPYAAFEDSISIIAKQIYKDSAASIERMNKALNPFTEFEDSLFLITKQVYEGNAILTDRINKELNSFIENNNSLSSIEKSNKDYIIRLSSSYHIDREKLARLSADSVDNNTALSDEDIVRLANKLAPLLNDKNKFERYCNRVADALLSALFTLAITYGVDLYVAMKESQSKFNSEAEWAEKIMPMADNLLLDLRIVVVKILDVRKSASENSPITGKLYEGNIVQIVENKQDWSYIVWYDNNHKIKIEGWVSTKHIKPLKYNKYK